MVLSKEPPSQGRAPRCAQGRTPGAREGRPPGGQRPLPCRSPGWLRADRLRAARLAGRPGGGGVSPHPEQPGTDSGQQVLVEPVRVGTLEEDPAQRRAGISALALGGPASLCGAGSLGRGGSEETRHSLCCPLGSAAAAPGAPPDQLSWQDKGEPRPPLPPSEPPAPPEPPAAQLSPGAQVCLCSAGP